MKTNAWEVKCFTPIVSIMIFISFHVIEINCIYQARLLRLLIQVYRVEKGKGEVVGEMENGTRVCVQGMEEGKKPRAEPGLLVFKYVFYSYGS